MAVFPHLPTLKPLPITGGVRRYALQENLTHEQGVVPAGFITDGASVPRMFWPLFSPTGPAFGAAIIHDWGYRYSIAKRAEVDELFLEHMTAAGLPWWRRRIIYHAVRIGAGLTWCRYRVAGVPRDMLRRRDRKKRK